MKAMNSVAKKSLLFFVVTITLFFALGFAFMPMCENIEWLRPQFVLLVLFAWCLVAPRYVNLTMAFFLGLILDLLYGTSLGENAIALVLCTYFVIKFEFAINARGAKVCVLKMPTGLPDCTNNVSSSFKRWKTSINLS